MLLWVFKDNNPQVDLKANFHISVNFFLLSKNIKTSEHLSVMPKRKEGI